MSWFSSKSEGSTLPPDAPNFHPVTSSPTLKGFGKLTTTDTAWAAATGGGFMTETQTWYSILSDGTFLMCQVIFSFLGVRFMPSQTQMTFKLYNPTTKKSVWKSINASGFTLGEDKRSCKAKEFEIKHTGGPGEEESEEYEINATLENTCKIAVKFTRPAGAPGFKFGEGPQGGYSVFGKETAEGKRDGMVIHRFHPIAISSGTIILEGQVIDAAGDGMFVHAIQGMMPNHIASRWNFAFFTSGGGETPSSLGDVRAVQMEFETTDDYGARGPKSGRVKCNIGAVYVKGKPLIVVGETLPTGAYPDSTGDVSRAIHTSVAPDAVTGYNGPTGLKFEFAGEALTSGGGRASAEVQVATSVNDGEGGLIERVSVLAEIPYFIRAALSSVIGIKPYIFQYLNRATLNVTLPDGDKVPVKGWMFNEATFISP